jgi:hypothetical protein
LRQRKRSSGEVKPKLNSFSVKPERSKVGKW